MCLGFLGQGFQSSRSPELGLEWVGGLQAPGEHLVLDRSTCSPQEEGQSRDLSPKSEGQTEC